MEQEELLCPRSGSCVASRRVEKSGRQQDEILKYVLGRKFCWESFPYSSWRFCVERMKGMNDTERSYVKVDGVIDQ
jgi:hypothetical protein